jgi:hypothetical protein
VEMVRAREERTDDKFDALGINLSPQVIER